MWTIGHLKGFLIYSVGITSRAIRQRLNEHRLAMLKGQYTLFDTELLKQGTRHEIWHGLWAGHDSAERKAELASRRGELQDAAQRQMNTFRIFAADIPDPRIQQRLARVWYPRKT